MRRIVAVYQSALGAGWVLPVEHYRGDLYTGRTAPRAGYVWHRCPTAAGARFKVAAGTGCPNRRFGCPFIG